MKSTTWLLLGAAAVIGYIIYSKAQAAAAAPIPTATAPQLQAAGATGVSNGLVNAALLAAQNPSAANIQGLYDSSAAVFGGSQSDD